MKRRPVRSREERIIRDLLAQAKAAGTHWKSPHGPHLAIKSTSEGRGYCNRYELELAGICGKACLAWQAAIKSAEDWLAEQEQNAVVQLEMVS